MGARGAREERAEQGHGQAPTRAQGVQRARPSRLRALGSLSDGSS